MWTHNHEVIPYYTFGKSMWNRVSKRARMTKHTNGLDLRGKIWHAWSAWIYGKTLWHCLDKDRNGPSEHHSKLGVMESVMQERHIQHCKWLLWLTHVYNLVSWESFHSEDTELFAGKGYHKVQENMKKVAISFYLRRTKMTTYNSSCKSIISTWWTLTA